MTDERHARPGPSELTGELPRIVRDALAAAGVRELTDADRETVDALVELGLDRDEAETAVRERRVPLVLTAQVLGEQPRHTVEELAERSGVARDVLLEVRRATGLPLLDRYSDADLEWAEMVGDLLEVLPLEAVLRGARARGLALSSVARSDLSMVRDQVIVPMRREGADDLAVSMALAETARALNDVAKRVLVRQYEAQLLNEVTSELSAIAARAEGAEVDIAVGFVDVVGYTALSARIDPRGLEGLLDAFEARVVDVLATAREVAAVKYLGDAVMLVAGDVVDLAEVMLALTDEVEELADTPLRGGIAKGPTLVREGDYFGTPVNTAARLTDVARPWSLLADDPLGDELEDAFTVRRIRPTRIRGVGVRRPLAVRRE